MNSISLEVPSWLKSYIHCADGYNDSGDFYKARQNLHNTHEDNLDYLKTYFPRTFAEVSKIIRSLSDKTTYFNHIEDRKTLKVLSAGCGTGGDISALILAVHAINPELSFEVSLFDGNEDALVICQKILKKIAREANISITVIKADKTVISKEADFASAAAMFSQQDLIITSKFLNEILWKVKNAYYYFSYYFSSVLADDGLMIFNEVVCHPYEVEHTYIPQYLNSDLNYATKDFKFSTVLPLTCHANRKCKNCDCYTRLYDPLFPKYDFTCRVISKGDFSDRIMPKVANGDYIINCCTKTICSVSA